LRASLGLGRLGRHPEAHERVLSVARREGGGVSIDTADRAAQLILEQGMTHRRGWRRAVRDHGVDRLVADLVKKARLPVVLDPGRVRGVEHRLDGRVGRRPELIDERRVEGL
jgi:hypothetical protein